MFVSRRTGQEITENDHILQSIEMILTTRIGTRVMRRDFGSRLPELVDQPLTPETITAIYAAANEAIAIWEQRVRVIGSKLNLDTAKVKSGVYDLTLYLEKDGEPLETSVSL